MISACQKEQKALIFLHVETNFSPKQHGSILSSECQSTFFTCWWPFKNKNHKFFLCFQILIGRECQKWLEHLQNSVFEITNYRKLKTTSLKFCSKDTIDNFLLEKQKSIKKVFVFSHSVWLLIVQKVLKLLLTLKFIDVQIHISQEMTRILPSQFQSAALFLWRTIAKIVYQFLFSFGILILGKGQRLLILTDLDIQIHVSSKLSASLLQQLFTGEELSKNHRFFLFECWHIENAKTVNLIYKFPFSNSKYFRTTSLISSIKKSVDNSPIEGDHSMKKPWISKLCESKKVKFLHQFW